MSTFLPMPLCVLHFEADLSKSEILLGTLGLRQASSEVVAFLDEIGFRFHDSQPGLTVELVMVDVKEDLGLPEKSNHNQILERGQEMGLSKCPAETPFQFMLAQKPLPKGKFQFATDAVRSKSDQNYVYIWSIVRKNIDPYPTLEADVYESADLVKNNEHIKYIFARE